MGAFRLLRKGDELCSSREIPIPSTNVQKVKEIYKKCKRSLISNEFRDTPLIHAARHSFANLVWGFIQCAKQTNTNLDTDETGELQKFLGYKNQYGKTALDVAIEKDMFDLVKAFSSALEGVSWQELITDRNGDGKTLMSLLSHHEFDEIIFEAMKAAGKGKVEESLTSISISVDEDKHQEVIVYTEHMMHPNTHPLSSEYKQSTTLNKLDDGQLELAPNGNTIIHLLSQFGRANDVKTILEKHPSLVYRQNHQGETPLFVASREGHLDILELLINYVKEKTDLEELVTRRDRYTALHIAIENHHAPIVFWLVNGLPQLANRINIFDESPLYFAAQRGYHHILRQILKEIKEKSFKGPNGKTALHAAVMSQESVGFRSIREKSGLECVKSLLLKKIDLLYIHDKNGWAPFYYAVYHDIERQTVRALLEEDPNIGYQNYTAGDGINTPAIHIAATQGHWGAIQVLMYKCHGSLDITDSKGRNILHVAVENRRIDIIKELFRDKKFRTLANQRDSDGNTPLHLFMASDIEIDEMEMDRGVNIYAVNNKNLTTFDVASSNGKRRMLIEAMETGVWRNPQTSSPSHEESHVSKSSDLKNESEIKGQIMTKFGDSLVVVTALIATASFAAAFTVPGGFDGNEGSNQGMPILLSKAAYKAFVVSNAVAFCCSCCVLFGYMRLQIYLVLKYDVEKEDKIEEGIFNITALQYMLTGIAMVGMAFAFITGTYVILAPSLAFAISLCATCVCIIVPFSFFPTKYFECFSLILGKSLEYLGLRE